MIARCFFVLTLIINMALLPSSSLSQSINNHTGEISDELIAFSSNHLKEQAYLHFDKPYYATGDTVYFKAYVTSGERHELSNLSGVLHVDLISIDNKVNQGIRLPLVKGLAWGDFVLPDTLAPGNYRIRAYTRWMLNDGNLFEQNISVGSVHTQKVPENSTAKAVIAKPDLQFFPESGQLITGLPAKVAFKAIGVTGLGIGIKGSIIDKSGKVICQLEPSHLGMGFFAFTPEPGKSYKANVMFADGSKNSLDLPAPVNKGIALSVNNDSLPKARVKILCNNAYFNENKGKDYTLLIYSGGSATTVPIKLDSPVINLDILKRHLHTGIATITLFSDANEPLCERLIFVQNYDKLNLNLSADKSSYATREKVSIKLNAKTRVDSAALGHFSVSVIDESKVDVNENKENTILSNLLLTSDLKGTVEQPNYYFTDINDEKLKELDLVMLTHGYRRFEWKQVLNNSNRLLAYQPEKSLEITGQAKSLIGASLAKANITLLPTQSKQVFTTKADDKGYFAFRDMAFWDSTRFILQAANAKGKIYTKLTYYGDKPVLITPAIQLSNENVNAIVSPAYLANSERQQEELNKLNLSKGKILKEVKIKGIKLNDKYETQSFAGAGHADQVLHSKDIGYGPSLGATLHGKLHGVTFSSDQPGLKQVPASINGGPMLVVIDGTQLADSDISNINPSDVETVEVLKYANAAIYGIQGGNGVLIITTKKGRGTKPEDIASTGILPITVQGYEKVREFYSPKYESGITYNHPDLRSTIYWKPELATDKDGNASFEYYNADGKGTYRVVIEGIDEKGNLGRQVLRYKVE
jgi:TonB-dependent SusC/RagA subfamily outer membrane receptor